MNVGEMLSKARTDANVSQSQLAKLMGVDRTTIQRWEDNATKIKLEDALKGFSVLGVPMYPYLMSALYTKELAHINDTSISEVKKELNLYINELDAFHIRELSFLLKGMHGSSPTGSLDLITAYLHLPLISRLCVAEDILTQYEVAETLGTLVNCAHIKPKTATLRKYTNSAKEAVLNGKESYTDALEDNG